MKNESSAPSDKKTWKVGTLTYTGAGLTVLFGWLLWGDFAWNMKERSVVPIAQLLLRQFEAKDMLVGFLVGSLPSAIAMILGPFISVHSDRHRGRWGRRIPYLLIPTPFAALSMAMLAFSPSLGAHLHELLGASSPGLNGCVLIVFSFFWSIFELATVIANTVLGGLINDVVPAEVIGRFFGLFRAVSLIAGIIFNFWLMGKAEEYYVWIFLAISALYGIGFTIMCLKVKEGEYPPPEQLPPAAHGGRFGSGLKSYLHECFANPYYLWIFLGMTFAILAFGPVNSFSVFYAKSIDMSMDLYGKYLALTFLISLAMSYWLGSLADRFHPLRLGIVSMILYAALAFWGGWFATTPGTFAIAFVGHGVLSGMYFTGAASLAQRLFPRTKFAQFFSAFGIVSGLGYLILPPLVGGFLDFNGHQYRYTFIMGGFLALLAVFALLVVHRRFMQLGGPKEYVAPE